MDSTWTDLREHWQNSSNREAGERDSWAEPEMEAIFRLTCDLKNKGWREICYCPKDGSMFLAWSPTMAAPYRCSHDGEWPDGRWWAYVDGDVWPDRPVLFKPIEESDGKPA